MLISMIPLQIPFQSTFNYFLYAILKIISIILIIAIILIFAIIPWLSGLFNVCEPFAHRGCPNDCRFCLSFYPNHIILHNSDKVEIKICRLCRGTTRLPCKPCCNLHEFHHRGFYFCRHCWGSGNIQCTMCDGMGVRWFDSTRHHIIDPPPWRRMNTKKQKTLIFIVYTFMITWCATWLT